jgi:hypothetical protein
MVARHKVPGKVAPRGFRPVGTVRLAVAAHEADRYHKRQFAF